MEEQIAINQQRKGFVYALILPVIFCSGHTPFYYFLISLEPEETGGIMFKMRG